MTIKSWLASSSEELKNVGIESARLDCLLILENILNKDRVWLLANQDQIFSAEKLRKINKLFKQRKAHKPMAYILGESEFYGRKFVVSPAVLQPRPESEAFFDLLPITTENIKNPRLADVGCGSGALGITASLEAPQSSVDLLDIDTAALKIAKINTDKFTTPLKLIKSDLLSNASIDYDILLCNLPYVPDEYPVNQAAMHEPRLALYGGTDGLDLYRKLYYQLQGLPKKPLFLLIESLDFQQPEIRRIFQKLGYKHMKTLGLVQLLKLQK